MTAFFSVSRSFNFLPEAFSLVNVSRPAFLLGVLSQTLPSRLYVQSFQIELFGRDSLPQAHSLRMNVRSTRGDSSTVRITV